MPFLVEIDSQDRRKHVVAGDSLSIGRARENDIRLKYDGVTRFHARLTSTGETWTVTDLDSHNGTLVNGTRLTPHQPQTLQDGDFIEVADVALHFCADDAREPQSVSVAIHNLKAGDPDAAQAIWDRYFNRVVAVAGKRIDHQHRAIADEEDLALSVLDSLCKGAANGNFQQLTDRDDLWKLLLAITRQKVVNRYRFFNRKKRGGDADFVDCLRMRDDGSVEILLDGFACDRPEPDELVEFGEEFDQLLRLLPNETMRQIVQLRLQRHTQQEIALRLNCSVRWVEINLQKIRDVWIRSIRDDSRD